MLHDRSVRLAFLLCATTVTAACSEIVGADFDVHARRPDAATTTLPDVSNDAFLDANGRSDDANADRSDSDVSALDGRSGDARDVALDARAPDTRGIDAEADGSGRDARVDHSESDVADGGHDDGHGGNSDDVAEDVVDAGTDPRPDTGTGRPTVVSGGFVSLGVPTRQPSSIQLRGQIVSGGSMRGVNATGITIEGRFQ